MSLDARLADLLASPIPTWVLDPDVVQVIWANPSALRLWNAESQADLAARQMTPLPASIQARLEAARQDLLAGRTRVDDFVFYPKGVPTPAWLHFSPILDENGRLLFLQQAIERNIGEATHLRMTEAFLHAFIGIACVQFDGQVLLKNPAAAATFGSAAEHWPDWLADPTQGIALLSRIQQEERLSTEQPVRTQQGERIHRLELCRLRDAVTGQLIALIQHVDQTERREAEQRARSQSKLAQQLETALGQIAEQHRQILELSAPLLEVDDGIIAVPLIGQLDAHRADGITHRLLPALVARRTRALILDLTGVAAFDDAGTQALVRILAAVRLLGVKPWLCGISPPLARTLAQGHVQTHDTPNARTLAEAVRMARAALPTSHNARPQAPVNPRR